MCSQPMARVAAVLASGGLGRGGGHGVPLGLRGNPECGIVESRGFAPTNPNHPRYEVACYPADCCRSGSSRVVRLRRRRESPAAAGRRPPRRRQARPQPGKHQVHGGLRRLATAPTAIRASRPIPSWPSSTPNTWSSSCRNSRPASAPARSCRRFAAQLSDADMKNIAYWAGSQKGQAGFRQGQGTGRAGRAHLPRRHRRPPGARLRRLPQPQRRRHSLRSTRACPASTPTTPTPSWSRFRDGARKNSLPMTQVAAKLNDREIKAVADYIAGLR